MDNVRKHPLAACESCSWREIGQYVASQIPKEGVRVAVVGEAPGANEARTGIPFTGPSGELLDRVMQHHGYQRRELALINVASCRPHGETVKPPKDVIAACSGRLRDDLARANAPQTLALGGTSAQALLNDSRTISKLRIGPARETEFGPVIATWHPAFCLRTPDSFPSFVRDSGKLNGNISEPWVPPTYRVFEDPAVALVALRRLLTVERIVIDIEAASDKDIDDAHPEDYDLLCVGIAYAKGQVVVFGPRVFEDQRCLGVFSELLDKCKVGAHNGKFDLLGLSPTVGIKKLSFDTMLKSYVLDERPRQHGLKMRLVEDLGAPRYDDEIAQYTKGKDGSFAKIPKELLYKYNAYDCGGTWDIDEYLSLQMSPKEHELHEFLIQAANMLMHVELSPLHFDLEYNAELEIAYKEKLDVSELAIQEHVGYALNPRSPMQIMKYFASNGMVVPTTERKFLEKILPQCDGPVAEFIELLLVNRNLTKTQGTYVVGLRKKVKDGRIPTTFSLHATTSGRLASRKPNLQNICFSDDTEILTDGGWKLFKELDKTEKVAQWNKDGTIQFVTPEEYIEVPYSGKMVRFQAGDHVDMLVTPDHRMISKARRQDTIFIEPASRYIKFGNRDEIIDRKLIRAGKKVGGIRLNDAGRISLEQAVAYQADGGLCNDWRGHGSITVRKDRKKKRLAEIFKGHEIREYGIQKDHYVYLKTDTRNLNLWLDMRTKNFKPDVILQLCKEDLEFFLSAVMRWDGDSTRGFTYLQHKDRRISVEVVQAAATLCGKSTSIYRKSDDFYTVNIHPKAERYFSRTNVTNVAYDGIVYCVNVPSSAIVVRRNGTPIISGNCRNKAIRNQFTAGPGLILVQGDYSQVEGRTIADLAKDKYLQRVFSNPEIDIFNDMCDNIWGPGNWDKENRVSIKSIFYGYAYGRKAKSIAFALKKPIEYAQNLMAEFKTLIPEVVAWQAAIKRSVLDGEDLSTPFGRKRTFHLITNENMEDVLNEALSYKPQSIASDICLRAAIRLQPMLKQEYDADIKLLVHDAIDVECRPEVKDLVIDMMRTEMVKSAQEYTDFVPFTVDFASGFRLGEL